MSARCGRTHRLLFFPLQPQLTHHWKTWTPWVRPNSSLKAAHRQSFTFFFLVIFWRRCHRQWNSWPYLVCIVTNYSRHVFADQTIKLCVTLNDFLSNLSQIPGRICVALLIHVHYRILMNCHPSLQSRGSTSSTILHNHIMCIYTICVYCLG